MPQLVESSPATAVSSLKTRTIIAPRVPERVISLRNGKKSIRHTKTSSNSPFPYPNTFSNNRDGCTPNVVPFSPLQSSRGIDANDTSRWVWSCQYGYQELRPARDLINSPISNDLGSLTSASDASLFPKYSASFEADSLFSVL